MRTTCCFFSTLNRVLKQCPRYYVCRQASSFPDHEPFVRTSPTTKSFQIVDEFSSINPRDYLKERGFSENAISAIPEIFFKLNVKPSQWILIDRKVAKLIALTVCARSNSEHILEFDAGLGLMSEKLLVLSEDLKIYVGFSSLADFLKEKFRDDLNKKVKVYSKTFPNLLGILYSKLQDPSVFLKLMEGLPLKPWTADLSYSVILPILSLRILKGLMSNLLTENSLKQFGRPEYFILMPNLLAEQCLSMEKCTTRNNQTHLLLNIFFDVQILLSDLPREGFLPWTPTIIKNNKATKMTDDYVYLLHVVPRVDRFEPFEDRDFLSSFVSFVEGTLRIQRRIIPTFELFVPNCGPCFIIEDDLTIYTTFSEVGPEKLFHLFKKLSTYPEFDVNMLRKLNNESLKYNDNANEDDEKEDENGEESDYKSTNTSHD